MAGSEKTVESVKKMGKDIGKKPWKGLDPSIGKEPINQTTMLFEPDIPMPEEQTIIPLPTESVANLEARRRRAKKAGSGRSSTILTEGLGG